MERDRELLSGVHATFTEGFTTPDLIDARNLFRYPRRDVFARKSSRDRVVAGRFVESSVHGNDDYVRTGSLRFYDCSSDCGDDIHEVDSAAHVIGVPQHYAGRRGADAVGLALRALRRFRALIDQMGVSRVEAIATVAGGYSNLEFDRGRGTRGSRYERIGALLREASGAEAAGKPGRRGGGELSPW